MWNRGNILNHRHSLRPCSLQRSNSQPPCLNLVLNANFSTSHTRIQCFFGGSPQQPAALRERGAFLEPLKPCLPADDHATEPPSGSVIVTIVLLNDLQEPRLFPQRVFLSFRASFSPSGQILSSLLNLILRLASYANGLWTFRCTRVCSGSLTPYRQTAPVPESSIRPKVYKTLYV